MSLNLGARAEAAIVTLQNSEAWKTLRDELAVLASKFADKALDAPQEAAHVANAYARGLRDLWVALEAVSTNKRQVAVEKPRTVRSTTTG